MLISEGYLHPIVFSSIMDQLKAKCIQTKLKNSSHDFSLTLFHCASLKKDTDDHFNAFSSFLSNRVNQRSDGL